MKKKLPALISLFFAYGIAIAQTGDSKLDSRMHEFVFASEANAPQTSALVLDKIQKETEELILMMAPVPLIPIADLIHHKMDAENKKSLRKHSRAKKPEPGCEI